MQASYDDITSRISTLPVWYDEHAVPRYCTFEPNRSASIHIGEIALVEIACQECKRLFQVAFSAVNLRKRLLPKQSKTKHYTMAIRQGMTANLPTRAPVFQERR